MFGDDTQFYLTINDVQDTEARLSDIMVDMGRWMYCKQLKLNENKTDDLVSGRIFDISRCYVHHL